MEAARKMEEMGMNRKKLWPSDLTESKEQERAMRKRWEYETIQWVQETEHHIEGTGFVKSTIINILKNAFPM